MLKKAKGCAFGLAIGTLIKAVTVAVNFSARVLSKLLVLFGLWIPLVYALFGVLLHFAFNFNPLDFSLYSSLYLSGAAACVVCCVIISVRNIIVRPARSVFDGYKHPLWEKRREEKIAQEEDEYQSYLSEKRPETLSPPDIDDLETKKYRKKTVDFLPPAGDFRYYGEENCVNAGAQLEYSPNGYSVPRASEAEPIIFGTARKDKPLVYFSKLEPDLLVHEYGDRFELFRIENGRSIFERAEYKQ